MILPRLGKKIVPWQTRPMSEHINHMHQLRRNLILQLELGQNILQLGLPVELWKRVVGHENRDGGGGESFGVGCNREERLRAMQESKSTPQ